MDHLEKIAYSAGLLLFPLAMLCALVLVTAMILRGPQAFSSAEPPAFAPLASAEALADFDTRLTGDLRAAFREVEFRLLALQASVEELEARDESD